MKLTRAWTDREVRNFFIRLEECLENIVAAPQRQKDSLRMPGAKEYQHSPQTTIFYSYTTEVVNILLVWINAKNPNDI
jgi:hypothetical protein